MTGWRNGGGAAAVLAASIMAAAAAGAQVSNTAVPAPIVEPTASATPIPIPAVPTIVLPPVRTPRPRASATPTPRPSDTPRPTLTATPTPQATPTVAAVPLPQPTAEAPTSTSTATPAPTPAPAAAPMPVAQSSGWWPFAVRAGLLALAVAWLMSRRRRERAIDVVPPADEVIPATPTMPAAASPLVSRARLTLGFRPIRAGLNLLSATSENEVVLTNIGDAAAEDIRVSVRLISAHADQDAELAAIYAQPIARPIVPAFTLQPGEQRVVSAVAALPRDLIRVLTVADRPIFVPIVAVNATYATGGVSGQTAQAFAVGVERAESAKLALFRLDAPPRSYDQIAARPHAAALER